MINTSNQTISVSKDLVAGFCSGVTAFRMVAESKYDRSYSKYAPLRRVLNSLSQDNLRRDEIDVDSIDALRELAVRNQAKLDDQLKNRIGRLFVSPTAFSALDLNELRRMARFVLYLMQSEGHVVLPVTFTALKAFKEELTELASEVARFCLTFQARGSDNVTMFRMTQHVPRLLICTTWLHPEDVRIDEAVSLNTFVLALRSGTAGFSAPTPCVCVRLFLEQLRQNFPDRVTYGSDDLAAFDKYFAFRLHLTGGHFGSTSELADQSRKRRRDNEYLRRYGGPRQLRAPQRKPVAKPTNPLDLHHLIYERKYERKSYFCDLSPLSFIDEHLSADAIELWSRLFESFLRYRQETRGLEVTTALQNSLRELADYLQICLPVYKYIAGANCRFPSRPLEFTRFPFIDNRGDEQYPPTLVTYIASRHRSAQARYTRTSHICMFFEFVKNNYGDADSSDIAGVDFRNPLSREFDLDPHRQAASQMRT